MISFNSLSTNIYLEKSLWQIASVIGLADKYKTDCAFPHWIFEKYFLNPLPHKKFFIEKEITEFRYEEKFFEKYADDLKSRNVNISGVMQSLNYFSHCKEKVRQQFLFTGDFQSETVSKLHPRVFEKDTIALIINRGDCIINNERSRFPVVFYLMTVLENFPDWKDYNIIVFSDDSDFYKFNFQCFKNFFYSNHLSDIEKLCMQSLCNHFICGNNSNSFWASFIGETQNTKIIHPHYQIRDRYKRKYK